MDPKWVDVFPINNGDIPASYVSLPEGNFWLQCSEGIQESLVHSYVGWSVVMVFLSEFGAFGNPKKPLGV